MEGRRGVHFLHKQKKERMSGEMDRQKHDAKEGSAGGETKSRRQRADEPHILISILKKWMTAITSTLKNFP